MERRPHERGRQMSGDLQSALRVAEPGDCSLTAKYVAFPFTAL